VCQGCKDSDNYVLDKTGNGRCIAKCLSQNASDPPTRPNTPFDFNGKKWPTLCIKATEAHFFGIGDWGGDKAGGHTWLNPGHCAGPGEENSNARPCADSDHWAQKYVARQMNSFAPTSKPDYVINVGDNWYPGGITTGCGADGNHPKATQQWSWGFEALYNGPELKGKPWMGVLGNHDYGGRSFLDGWDQQIFITWDRTDWLLPAQFWSRRVQYEDFAIEYFFLDSNHIDTRTDPGHDICQGSGTCWGMTKDNCPTMLNKAWMDGIAMTKAGMAASTAEWHIVVTHFPAQAMVIQPEIKDLDAKYGIDLMITGHNHIQDCGSGYGGSNISWIVQGGGGGVTTDAGPSEHDGGYGFVDYQISRTDLTASLYSWGGPNGDFKTALKTLAVKSHKTKTEDQAKAKVVDWVEV